MIRLDFAFEARINLAPPLEAGEMLAGRRRIIPITGGTVEGPRLGGTVLPGGAADWQKIRRDGVAEIVARYAIEARDGAILTVVNRGLRHGPPEIMARVAAGETVDPALYYFRTAPVFEAPPGAYEWLTRALFVATGARHPDAVHLRVFEVL